MNNKYQFHSLAYSELPKQVYQIDYAFFETLKENVEIEEEAILSRLFNLVNMQI